HPPTTHIYTLSLHDALPISISYFPNDSRVLYTRDQGGNENNHIYLLDADGKERDLTPGDKLKAQFLGWSQDGRAFYFMTNERDADRKSTRLNSSHDQISYAV